MANKILIEESYLKELVSSGKTFQEILDILNVSKATLTRNMKKYNLSTLDYKLNYNKFDKIDTEEKAYWLGFLFADGYNGVQNIKGKLKPRFELSLKGSDISHLKKFSFFMECKRDIIKLGTSKCCGKTYERCRFLIANQHLHDILYQYGCVHNKSLVLKFPEINIFSNKSLIYDFIRGYVDGDGCLSLVTYKSGNIALDLQIIGTQEFLEKVIQYLGIPKDKYIKDKRRPNTNTYTIRYIGKTALQVSNLLYEHASIYLDRKKNIYDFAVLQSNL